MEIECVATIGRPTKFNKQRRERIIEAVRTGCCLDTSARLAGITYDCLNDWMNKGRNAGNGPYFLFLQAIMRASSEREDEAVDAVKRAASGRKIVKKKVTERTNADGTKVRTEEVEESIKVDWQAAAWWLERTNKDQYSRRVQYEERPMPGTGVKARIEGT